MMNFKKNTFIVNGDPYSKAMDQFSGRSVNEQNKVQSKNPTDKKQIIKIPKRGNLLKKFSKYNHHNKTSNGNLDPDAKVMYQDSGSYEKEKDKVDITIQSENNQKPTV